MTYLDGVSKEKISCFQERVIRYYHKKGRKDLPWRQTDDPWKILIAETLLRKTTVSQAKNVYEQLSKLSPDQIRDYPLGDLENLLKPLGIYRERAKLLKRTSILIGENGKEMLSDWGFLNSLPGVGPYTASMIFSAAYGKSKPGLDSNMIRVLARVFSIQSEKPRPHTDKELWEAAEKIVPEKKPIEFNWGVMDLASALCKPRNPVCSECPIENICDYVNDSEGL